MRQSNRSFGRGEPPKNGSKMGIAMSAQRLIQPGKQGTGSPGAAAELDSLGWSDTV